MKFISTNRVSFRLHISLSLSPFAHIRSSMCVCSRCEKKRKVKMFFFITIFFFCVTGSMNCFLLRYRWKVNRFQVHFYVSLLVRYSASISTCLRENEIVIVFFFTLWWRIFLIFFFFRLKRLKWRKRKRKT